MRTDNTEQTLFECLGHANLGGLPAKLSAETKNWMYAICLIKRKSLEEDYVIVKNNGFEPMCIQSFLQTTSFINEYLEIYPYDLYDPQDIPNMETIDDIVEFLSQNHNPSEFTNKDGEYDKDKLRGLIARENIAATLAKRNQGNVSKSNSGPKEYKVLDEFGYLGGNKKGEINNKEVINESESTTNTGEVKAKRGRPKKQATAE